MDCCKTIFTAPAWQDMFGFWLIISYLANSIPLSPHVIEPVSIDQGRGALQGIVKKDHSCTCAYAVQLLAV